MNVITGGRRTLGFVAAATTFASIFAAGAAPIPLYSLYRLRDGVTDAQLSLVAVGYFCCAVFALLVLGRLSDHLGRRPLTFLALALALVGCAVLCTVGGFVPLLAGRALQGLAAGLAASAVAAYAVDSAPARPRWLMATVTASSPNVGLAVGVFGAGALAQGAPLPRVLSYVAAAALLVGCGVLVSLAPETGPRRPGALAALRPRLKLPPAARPLLPAAAAIIVATWGLGGYYQAFGPSVAATDLGSTSPLIAATVFASYNAPAVFGGPLAARLEPRAAQRLGMCVVAAAAIGLLVAIALRSAVAFILVGMVAGVAMGVALTGSMRRLLPTATAGDRAALLALVYAVSYTGAAVPGLIAGQLSRVLPLPAITAGYVGLAVLAAVITLVRNPLGPVPHAGSALGRSPAPSNG